MWVDGIRPAASFLCSAASVWCIKKVSVVMLVPELVQNDTSWVLILSDTNYKRHDWTEQNIIIATMLQKSSSLKMKTLFSSSLTCKWCTSHKNRGRPPRCIREIAVNMNTLVRSAREMEMWRRWDTAEAPAVTVQLWRQRPWIWLCSFMHIERIKQWQVITANWADTAEMGDYSRMNSIKDLTAWSEMMQHCTCFLH